jgi:H+-transporting ATPase
VATPAPPPASGLTADEARRRLQQFGQNSMPDTAQHPLRNALAKFWAPVPWMLEATILLELLLGKYVESAIIAALLAFNAALGFFQESRAQATLTALNSRLALSASVRRDNAWKTVPAAEVTATRVRTKFGRTAELVRTAHAIRSQQTAVFRVVRNLAACNGVIIVMLVAYAHFLRMPTADVVALALTAVLASIPVALPATFTLASAFGARALAKLGVLPTRLSAVDEAASMDVLCADKTGTLTRNELEVTTTRSMPGFDVAHVLALAALASSDGGQDPVDAAIRAAAAAQPTPAAPGVATPGVATPQLLKFTAFDPATKMSEAMVTGTDQVTLRVVKGAFAAIAGLAAPPPNATAAAGELEGQGYRVLAVAVGPPPAMRLAGLIALSDPPRADSAALISELHGLGVGVVMVMGDAAATAAIVANLVGLKGGVCPPGPIPLAVSPEQFAVFAGVLPEDKYKLVAAFQKNGHIVGMCGDGANDAPALRQAQIGIAVSTATDVAKSAAGMVLTKPGLEGIVAAVREGRVTFQRILTYTLNSITKKIVQVMFLASGLIMTGHAILTPLLMVLIMITGDFLGMSLTTDNVRPSPRLSQSTASR